MCYPKPGPRCSSHAAKAYARAQILCGSSTIKLGRGKTEEETAQWEKLIARREQAKREYYATPAGMAVLERNIEDSKHKGREEYYHNLLQDAKDYRAHMLALVKMKDQGDINNHNQSKVISKYEHLGMHASFPRANEDRIGWQTFARSEDKNPNAEEDSRRIRKLGTFMSKASTKWMARLTPEEVAVMEWLTNDGTRIMSEHTAGRRESVEKLTHLSPEELDARHETIKNAFKKAPRLRSPIVVMRGVHRDAPFDLDEVVKTGTYTAPTALSTTLNPGIANSFGFRHVVLEMKTRQFSTPTNFSIQHEKESEILIAPGSKFRVVGVQENVRYGWEKEYMVDGYTVVQMEEISDSD